MTEETNGTKSVPSYNVERPAEHREQTEERCNTGWNVFLKKTLKNHKEYDTQNTGITEEVPSFVVSVEYFVPHTTNIVKAGNE